MTFLLVLVLVAATLVAALILLRRIRHNSRLRLTPSERPVPAVLPARSGEGRTIATTASHVAVQSGDATLVEIVRWTEDVSRPATLAFPRQAATALQPLLQLLPTAASTSYVGAGTYVMRFSSEALEGLRNGTLELMGTEGGAKRAIAVVADGKQIFEHATLQSLSIVPIATAAVWQGMAMITAQKFLVDIDAKLKRIETGVADLRTRMDAEQLGRLQANLVYLLQLRDVIPDAISRRRSHAFETELESIHRELLADTLSLGLQMESLLGRIAAESRAPSSLTRPRVDRELVELLGEYSRLHRTQGFAMLLSGLATEFRVVIAGSGSEAEHRLGLVKSELVEQNRRIKALYRRALRRIRVGSKSWRLPIFGPPAKDETVRGILRQISGMSSQMQREIEQAVRNARTRAAMSIDAGPLELLVTTTEKGGIAEIGWLPPASKSRSVRPCGGG